MFVDFFGKEVCVFTASEDPLQRILYMAKDLAVQFSCSKNMLDMFLNRRKRNKNAGIFQATCIISKQQSRKDIRIGGYFISIEVCREFEAFLKKKAAKLKAQKELALEES